jgi:clan AA aspartic protease (TIGR02281 family)
MILYCLHSSTGKKALVLGFTLAALVGCFITGPIVNTPGLVFLGFRLPLFSSQLAPVPTLKTAPLASSSARLGAATAQPIRIPLLKERKHGLHVSMRLNNQVEAPFLVDTGATYTVISPTLADELGIVVPDNGPSITLATANGLAKAPLVTIDRMAVNGYEMRQLQVVIRPLGDSTLDFDGLLGLNFFQDMDFAIKKDRLELSIAR